MTLDPGQHGTGGMDAAAFRRHGHAVVDWIADHLEGAGDPPVLSPLTPGEVRDALPPTPPAAPEPVAAILGDLDRVVGPAIARGDHAASHPAATALGEVTLDWLRQLLGLDEVWRGVLTETASVSTLVALAAAREQADLDVRNRGLAGRPDLPALRVYTSVEAQSSVERAAITLGLGRDGVRLVPVDDARRMDVAALREAVEEDVRLGYRPIAIVATTGSTSTASVDPVAAIADRRDTLVEELGTPLWLHVDGAHGGVAAICEELRWVLDGVDRADSFVMDLPTWVSTPVDCSALYVRDPATLTRTASLVPEHLTTDDQGVTDDIDRGVQLARRVRSLKLWAVLRYFGAEGLAARIRHHVAQAQRVVAWVEAHDHLELAAPVPLWTVCFRSVVPGEDEDTATERNRAWMTAVDASGDASLSHTVLDGRYVLRLATGSRRTTDERLDATLVVLDRELAALLP